MSDWVHVICGSCWDRRCMANAEPGREPVCVADASLEKCCYCGGTTREGIYVRESPTRVPCGGQHGAEAD